MNISHELRGHWAWAGPGCCVDREHLFSSLKAPRKAHLTEVSSGEKQLVPFTLVNAAGVPTSLLQALGFGVRKLLDQGRGEKARMVDEGPGPI